MKLSWQLIVLMLGSVACSTSASAAIINFDTLAGPEATPFTTYTQNGFTVTATQGDWAVAETLGNPTPAIFGTSLLGAIQITTTGNFTFSSVDLADGTRLAAGPFVTYSITGFLSGNSVLNLSGTTPGPGVFTTVTSPNTTQILDRLLVTLNQAPTPFDSYNVDNIVVNAATIPTVPSSVPEPSSLFLVGGTLGLAGLTILRSHGA
jgi:hypothetical protein